MVIAVPSPLCYSVLRSCRAKRAPRLSRRSRHAVPRRPLSTPLRTNGRDAPQSILLRLHYADIEFASLLHRNFAGRTLNQVSGLLVNWVEHALSNIGFLGEQHHQEDATVSGAGVWRHARFDTIEQPGNVGY